METVADTLQTITVKMKAVTTICAAISFVLGAHMVWYICKPENFNFPMHLHSNSAVNASLENLNNKLIAQTFEAN